MVDVSPGVVLPRTRRGEAWVVGGLVTDGDGRLFVQRRSPNRRRFPGSWDLVGGHVDPGESLVDGLAREVREETGWTLQRILAAVATHTWWADDGVQRYEIDLLVAVGGDLSGPQLETHKHTEGRWIGPDELDLLGDPQAPDSLIRDVVADGFAILSSAATDAAMPRTRVRDPRR